LLTGQGASPAGDHPFLTRYNIATKESQRLFQRDDDHYEVVDALLDAHGDQFLTRRESPVEPPNYFVRTAGTGAPVAITHYPDPQPIMRKVEKRLVTYKRPDGVDMSFVLYLPPDYKPGTKLPTVVWAYPREYEDARSAGEVSGSSKRFTEIGGYSEIFFAPGRLRCARPCVHADFGRPAHGERPFNLREQVVADAKAAIDKAVEIGVTAPARVGVGGHNADKIKTPLLLIHGKMDDNDGTFPIQSERMYEAVRGNSGTVRLVFLPFEAHGYRAKETIQHVLWEKFQWFDKYVKGAGAGTNN
jgi:dipeptidyl aminopeptidase/acylaminoacyl peptidase